MKDLTPHLSFKGVKNGRIILPHLQSNQLQCNCRKTGFPLKTYGNDIPYKHGSYEYVVDENLCIGCSFCAGICPTGVWKI